MMNAASSSLQQPPHPQPLLDSNIGRPLLMGKRNNSNNKMAAASAAAASATAGNTAASSRSSSGHHRNKQPKLQQQQFSSASHNNNNNNNVAAATEDFDDEEERKGRGDSDIDDFNDDPLEDHDESHEDGDDDDGADDEEPPALLLTIPALVGRGTPRDGLRNVDNATLERFLRPVMDGLERLDALSLLQCEPITAAGDGTDIGGTAIVSSDGVRIRPLHDDVVPPIADPMTVRYLHLSEVPDQYSMGIFIFPPHARIPLHDHPGMCVLSRVLYGDVHRFSLDLARESDADAYPAQTAPPDPHLPPSLQLPSSSLSASLLNRNNTNLSTIIKPAQQQPPPMPSLPEGSKRAYKNRVDHLVAPGCTMLYPYEGNLHEFVAGPSGAGILDVLLPPYDDSVQRDCTFYTIREDREFDEQRQQRNNNNNTATTTANNNNNKSQSRPHRPACWIVPTGQPEDFHCISGRYKDMGA